MESKVLDLIRDRFKSLENQLTSGFDEVNSRLKILEDKKAENHGKTLAFSFVGGCITTLGFWIIGLIA